MRLRLKGSILTHDVKGSNISLQDEEADEVQYWLEVLEELGTSCGQEVRRLNNEASEIVAIMVSSINTARKNSS